MVNKHEIIQVRAMLLGLSGHRGLAGKFEGESLRRLMSAMWNNQVQLNELYLVSEDSELENFILSEAGRLWSAQNQAGQNARLQHAHHIFSVLKEAPAVPVYINPAPFEKFEHVFPVTNMLGEAALLADVQRFYDELLENPPVESKSIAEGLLTRMRHYLGHVAVGSAQVAYPEQALAMARIASILLDIAIDNQLQTPAELGDFIQRNPPFLLVGADVSGIQQYIYSIIPRGAAKNLKGRSFYVQLLIEHIKAAIQEETTLNDLHTLYASGGGFYLMLPNTESIQTILASFANRLEAALFDEFGEALYVALGWVPCVLDGLSGPNLIENWRKLGEQLSFKKQHKHAVLLSERFDTFFVHGVEEGMDNARDAITGSEIPSGQVRQLEKYTVSESTLRLAELGKKLKKAELWHAFENQQSSLGEAYRPADLGPYSYFISISDYHRFKPQFTEKPVAYELNKIGKPGGWGSYFYGGNDYPENAKGDPKNFEELADFEETKGLKKLGVLRMDVDSLGALFGRGFSEEQLSLPYYTQLSRQLDLFFRGFLNQLWQESDKTTSERVGYAEYSQIIYSGGDDLFIVGRWDVLIAMAEEIRAQFGRFTANPKVGISGGLTIVNPKFPLLRAADMAADAEKDAKAHKMGKNEKDAFTMLGYPLNWQHEYPFVKQQKELLLQLMKEKELPNGFTNRVAVLHDAAAIKNHQITQVQSIWRLAYFIKRQITNKTPQRVTQFFDTWKEAVTTGMLRELPETEYHPLELLLIIARWAELDSRKHQAYGK